MISSGRAVVTRDVGDGRPPVELAQLGPGDSFGEEALLSGRPRNCGVVMLSAGLLLRLSRQDFNDLIREPVARFQPYAKAVRRVADGAKWLDVRSPDEHAAGHLPDALNLPWSCCASIAARCTRTSTTSSTATPPGAAAPPPSS